jgi:hypothetical protein
MAHLSCFCNHLLRTGGKSLRGPRCRVRRSVELTDWFCETAWNRFAADRERFRRNHRLAYNNIFNIADVDAGAVAKQLKEELQKRTGK